MRSTPFASSASTISRPPLRSAMARLPVLLGEGGALTLPDGLAQFGTSIHREVEAGDHTIVLLRLHEVRQDDTAMPLVFHRSTFDSLLAPR